MGVRVVIVITNSALLLLVSQSFDLFIVKLSWLLQYMIFSSKEKKEQTFYDFCEHNVLISIAT